MYNFLDYKLMPKVSTNSPATDNYEATNLISDKEAIRARGYLAYTVIKPPVELEFEFICPVNISYIVLSTTVGTQKCTGIELFVKNSNNPSYLSIARAVYDKPAIIFCDSKKFSKTNPPICYDATKDLYYFKSDKFRLFSEACFLKVVIFRTARSVPCLGSIKVCGEPAKSCSQTTKDTINKIMGRPPNHIVSMDASDKNDLKIPEDFTDDLTCEIMANPMTLPSGKTVDRDTLEKHIETEKSFGRKPCDPFTGLKFTGLKFTETRKPVMNVALKSRIDMFLLQNANNPITYGLKRSLGGCHENRDYKRIKFTWNDQNGRRKCCVCSQDEVLYVIPCKHFFCRSCLLALKILKCSVCQQEFLRSETERCYS